MSKDKFRLDGRIVVVSGAGRGIGIEVARYMVNAGARIIIAEIDRQTGEDAASELGPMAEFVPLDVADRVAVDSAAEKILARHGRVDVLVNNAAICIDSNAEETSDEVWRRQMSVDLDGVFYCCRAFGRKMIEEKAGSIINISSIAAFVGLRPQNHVAYSVAKAGVAQLSRVLASEWARHCVRVNSILPGYTKTPMPLGVGDDLVSKWLEMIPMGRILDPEEIAGAALFLASDASSGITGHLLVVDGGYTIW
ncbi:SDR family NAD(P)-dependent oxidoreductase [Allomesorhizobium camelthorni]|uniref:SDR family oxidoreductase n=1 Tax=Allomesorhizobium camelthorni TaxID=475069 RepID=A0A6G4WMD9_9HYPH|nr:SDR family oxidoreductase [Mesorhizobium camelthorni]NGO55931.1 SDR family oxidoreductase [Mesorhizobium camelthorni]